jgi:hypothetical protein
MRVDPVARDPHLAEPLSMSPWANNYQGSGFNNPEKWGMASRTSSDHSRFGLDTLSHLELCEKCQLQMIMVDERYHTKNPNHSTIRRLSPDSGPSFTGEISHLSLD